MYNEWRHKVGRAEQFKVGCLHRVWKSENGQTSRVLMVVPKVRIPEVLNVQYKGPRGGHLRITKTLEKEAQILLD